MKSLKVWCILLLVHTYVQVHCNSVDPSLNPVKGRFNYDARSQKAEFIPQNTLYPSSKYMVKLMGRAVTTSQCSNSNNIKNAELHFETCNPAPKEIGIKLKEGGVVRDITCVIIEGNTVKPQNDGHARDPAFCPL